MPIYAYICLYASLSLYIYIYIWSYMYEHIHIYAHTYMLKPSSQATQPRTYTFLSASRECVGGIGAGVILPSRFRLPRGASLQLTLTMASSAVDSSPVVLTTTTTDASAPTGMLDGVAPTHTAAYTGVCQHCLTDTDRCSCPRRASPTATNDSNANMPHWPMTRVPPGLQGPSDEGVQSRSGPIIPTELDNCSDAFSHLLEKELLDHFEVIQAMHATGNPPTHTCGRAC